MEKVKNIIFDYGNVIFEIDFKRAQNALSQLGIKNIEEFFGHKGQADIFSDLETGAITPQQFRQGIRDAAGDDRLTDENIDRAWNSLLVGVPENIHDVLLEVKKRYRTFLLSNTNEIHYNYILAYLKKEHQIDNNDHLFDKAYYSQIMLLRKPHPEIFIRVLEENELLANETLFIDDSPQHLVGAEKAGLQTLLMDRSPKNLRDFLVAHGLL